LSVAAGPGRGPLTLPIWYRTAAGDHLGPGDIPPGATRTWPPTG